MNRISPKALLHSKWTKQIVESKEKHFVITELAFDDDKNVVHCVIQAVINKKEYQIHWRELKNKDVWLQGWQ